LRDTVDREQAMRRFSAALDSYPAGFSGNRLNLLLLEDAEPISAAREYQRRLDDLSLLEERREYLIDERCPWPFPRIHVGRRPDPWLISQRLFERFHEAGHMLPTQSDIAGAIEEQVRKSRPAVVALMIVDGLSYYDLPENAECEPYLVAGVSTTEYGYRQVIGRPSISRRLFALGYTQQLGYTYFPPETNELSRDIYGTFSSSQITRIRAFDEILKHVKDIGLSRGYIQISSAGLDQLCHAHYDRPPREHYLEQILSHYHDLLDCLAAAGRNVLACLTADHGILWREDIEDRIEIVSDLFREDIRSPRYIRGSVLRPYGRCCRCDGQNYTLLRAPLMTRKFRNNEWGVHGGISAWESIVPFCMK